MELEKKLKLLPDQPGIYRFFSKAGKIVYIGKAKNLKNRVRSYFIDSHQTDYRVAIIRPNVFDMEWIVTNTEAEALILEDQLIKTHRPRYNIQLKDDKSYPYFKLSVQERFPRLSLVREIKRDGSQYFGPYVAVHRARATWRVIKRHFPLRQSKMPLDGQKTYRPCLNYQLKRCLAPCAGFISPEKYDGIVQHVLHILRGNYEELIDSLKKEMDERAEELQFEEAAALRDQIDVIRQTLQKQRIVSTRKIDRDVFALVRSGGFAGIQVLFIRNGILLSDDFFLFKRADLYDDREIIRSILSRLYVSGDKLLPREIFLPFPYDEATMLEDYFSQRRDTRLKILFPQRGENKALLELARKNGEQNLSVEMQSIQADTVIIETVRKSLKLKNLPYRVECFDVSNISGTSNVASMVVWEGNQASKSEYRKYKIKTLDGANDYAAMEEVLSRRYKKAADGGHSPPDLILIDGGKGQLSTAVRILENQGVDLEKVDVIGLAKGRSERRSGVRKEFDDYEYVVKPKRKNPIRLIKNTSTLHFLQNIRDEAHRFAVSYHRQLRGKSGLHSKLSNIPGIGPKKRKILLKSFGSLKKIGQASTESLESIEGISAKDARSIHDYFNPSGSIPEK
ncbi:MAG: excinuclease ABC subunit UvrC [Proteobacteria bacterium]|nr:excinuclease ABC subunit UvrC [Pseudomonadota bacterium]